MRAACLVVADRNEIEYIKGDWTSLEKGLKALKERSSQYSERIKEAIGRVLAARTQSNPDGRGGSRDREEARRLAIVQFNN